MKKLLLAAIVIGTAFIGQSKAQTPCPLTYEFFEHAVPHLDMEACPTDLARKGAFCRASVGSDAVHVFVFSEDGDRCLLGTKNYQTGQYQFSIR